MFAVEADELAAIAASASAGTGDRVALLGVGAVVGAPVIYRRPATAATDRATC
jgi:hypothetical protein